MQLPELTGVILAGGQSQRMGGNDKGLIKLAGKYLYEKVLTRLRPQVNHIIINANRNHEYYKQSGYLVISDSFGYYDGPLAGIITCLKQSRTEWLLFVPCDTPNIPVNLANRLWYERYNKPIAYACDKLRAHPTLCLINKSQIEPLNQYLCAGNRKMMLFFQQQNAQPVYFYDETNAFNNMNSPEDCLNWQQDR